MDLVKQEPEEFHRVNIIGKGEKARSLVEEKLRFRSLEKFARGIKKKVRAASADDSYRIYARRINLTYFNISLTYFHDLLTSDVSNVSARARFFIRDRVYVLHGDSSTE